MRTTVSLGSESASPRLSSPSSNGKIAGSSESDPPGAGGGNVDTLGGLNPSGWNTISSVTQTTPSWIGDPASGAQIQIVTTTETVVDRYNVAPGGLA